MYARVILINQAESIDDAGGVMFIFAKGERIHRSFEVSQEEERDRERKERGAHCA